MINFSLFFFSIDLCQFLNSVFGHLFLFSGLCHSHTCFFFPLVLLEISFWFVVPNAIDDKTCIIIDIHIILRRGNQLCTLSLNKVLLLISRIVLYLDLRDPIQNKIDLTCPHKIRNRRMRQRHIFLF